MESTQKQERYPEVHRNQPQSLPPAGKLVGIRKIAVLRANAIGDLIFSLPAIQALRDTYPKAEIVLLGQQWHADFLQNRPGPIDRVAVVPGFVGLDGPPNDKAEARELEAFFEAMQAEKFDLAVQLYGGGRYSNPYTRSLGARVSIGMKTPDADALDRWVPYIYFQPEVLRYLEVVRLVGAQTCQVLPKIETTPRDLEESLQALPETRKPLVALHAGSGDPRRRWPAKKFAQAADAINQMGYQPVLIGSDLDLDLVASILQSMETPALSVCDQLSLGGLAGLFTRCKLLISNDSGPLHLAQAVGTPTVGIFWCGNVINAGPLATATNRPLLSWRLNCPICGRDVIYDPCEHRPSFVDEVTLDEVLGAARDLLERP